jgi:hypothetical protein
MIDLKTISLIDDQLRAIFPASSDQLFGGSNVLLCGDFFQLPPVAGKALYSRSPTRHDYFHFWRENGPRESRRNC